MPLYCSNTGSTALRDAESPAAEHGGAVIVHQQLLCLLGKSWPVAGAVLLDEFYLPAEHAALLVDLRDREFFRFHRAGSLIAIVPVTECRMPTVTLSSVTARPVVSIVAVAGPAAIATRGSIAAAGSAASPLRTWRRPEKRLFGASSDIGANLMGRGAIVAADARGSGEREQYVKARIPGRRRHT